MPLAYTVIITCPGSEAAERVRDWLVGGHARAVLDAGASSAMLVRRDEPADRPVLEVRYLFPDRAAFERYEREHAPDLRADGLERFPVDAGFGYARTLGDCVDAR